MTGGNGNPPPPPERTVFAPIPTDLRPAPSGQIKIGDLLNHIFEVRRFIARGGMGEVYEGINVNSDERVAVKVILPHLAADPQVQAMFRKEARTLTRLNHRALMQYRVLAQEPQLGVFYIVTEYIDGQNLSDILAEIAASPAQLAQLTRTLAEGLAVAHSLGVIHRDISPDNVMLEDGRLDRAKIIDFGIVKELGAGTSTIIGDGFAGKLNYVAPEQLGDFNKEVGPWTDVYSLGLTILAVARGQDVDMGATLVDAVDRRRAGPDLSPAPPALRPILERMLRANPAERLRSMEEVLQVLADPSLALAAGGKSAPAGVMESLGSLGQLLSRIEFPKSLTRQHAIIGGASVAALALVLLVVALAGGGEEAPPPPAPAGAAVPVTAQADIGQSAQRALEAGLRDVPCSWLEVANVDTADGKVSVALRGVAGRSAEALDRIGKTLAAAGLVAGAIDFSEVSPITANICAPLEAFQRIRTTGGARLSVAQRKFEMDKLPPEVGADAGKLGAKAVFDVNLTGLKGDLTLVGLDEAGDMGQMIPNRAMVVDPAYTEALGNETYRFTLNTTHSGWSGILILTGRPPFDEQLFSGTPASRGPDWSARFAKLAAERGWTSEMVWYRTVDELPNTK